MIINPISRRSFLQGAGKAVLAIPFLSSLLSRAGFAQMTPPPPRYVFMHIPYGPLYPRFWYPARTLQTIVNLFPQSRFTDWWMPSHAHDMRVGGIPSNATTGISYYFDQKFHSLASKMIFLQGLDPVHADHYQAHLLGNYKRAKRQQPDNFFLDMPTIDHIMAYAPNFYGPSTGIVRQLILSPLKTPEHNQGISYAFQNRTGRSGAVIMDQHDFDAKKVFDKLFANLATPPSSTPSLSNTPLVDAIQSDYLRVRNGRAISAEDKLLLDAHIQEIADLEKIPTMSPSPTCSAPASVGVVAGKGIDNGKIDVIVKDIFLAYNRLITAAFQCQITRVVNMDLHYNALINLHQHDDMADYNKLPAVHKEIIDTVVFDLVNRLNSIPDADGNTLLDNSIVHLTAPASWKEHVTHDVPNVIFGSGGGRLKTGQYIDYGDQAIRERHKSNPKISDSERAYGLWQNQLNVSIMQSMGLTPQDYNMAKLGVLRPVYDPMTYTTYGETLGPDSTKNAHYSNSTQVAGQFLPYLKA